MKIVKNEEKGFFFFFKFVFNFLLKFLFLNAQRIQFKFKVIYLFISKHYKFLFLYSFTFFFINILCSYFKIKKKSVWFKKKTKTIKPLSSQIFFFFCSSLKCLTF